MILSGSDAKQTNLAPFSTLRQSVNYNGQNVPMILVEQASLVSAFPYAAEDPVYTPPTENSTTTPGYQCCL